jgi:hypothetical protein
MTEAEWQNEQLRSQGMAWVLHGTRVTRTKADKRKLRLFACACCRCTWDLLTDPLLRQAVEVAERFAEAQIGKDELAAAYESVRGLGLGTLTPDAPGHRERTAANMAISAAHPKAFSAAFDMTAYPVPLAGCGIGEKVMDAALCGLLRCVFGNPFRPLPPIPRAVLAWNDGTVRRIAAGIYEERAFDRLPILHDALLDAGCDNEDILAHCREPGPHARGCWVVDLILAKS